MTQIPLETLSCVEAGPFPQGSEESLWTKAWELDRSLPLTADHAWAGCPLEQSTVLAAKKVLWKVWGMQDLMWEGANTGHGHWEQAPPSLRESRNSVSGCCRKIFFHWLLGIHCTRYPKGWTPSFHFETTFFDNISPFQYGDPSFKMSDQQDSDLCHHL